MKINVHCESCGTDFTVHSINEPQFCCFCQEEVLLDLVEEEMEEEY